MAGDPCGTQAVTLAGGSLYATSLTSPNQLLLQRRDPDTGRALDTTAPDAAPDGVTLAATRHDLWAAGGFPGANGDLYWYTTRPLRLRGRTRTDGPALPPDQTPLPSFGEVPDIDLSDHTIWVAGFGVLACLNSAAGTVNAMTTDYTGPIISSSIIVTPHAVYAIAIDTGTTPTGIVKFDPPTACTTS